MTGSELIFKAMADSTRQRILRVLSAEELGVTELVEVLDQPQSTISRHLKVLRDAGLVVERRNGPLVLHSACPVSPEPVDSVNAPGAGHDDNSHGIPAIRDRLLHWVAQQPLGDELRGRLERVIRSRRAGEADFFDRIGTRWDQLRVEAFGDAFELEALTWLLPSDWTVADVGTGTGHLLGALSARFAQVIAVDPAEAMLDAARNRPDLQQARNISFRAGSLERLPIETGTLDLAIASLVMHHVADPPAALRELRRCIRSAGYLLLIEQETHHLAEFHQRMSDRWWGFEPAALAEWTRQAGFATARTHPLATARPTARRGIESPKLFALVAS
ncbi:MAG TPA: metalloregulator ArsR/SmtB family transcription factor [Phycisphaerae bacterium]|nr:metalloregulator ArsR/SmtB family transcription factor [Phycisphaerae bacterium]HOM49855.1 metalloregulator ArsR/SmtB family transcription factor [Phycisphaerae bacterium]HON67710.1 metalloregulator ArsR/SmtB family transcription factor [Phycisphaerae bacterium]HOQ87648.1 metalloregulator ArsR/SmtB family transcription factor [Phycisphaerae bacterium]HPP25225.1 metalloregulator ArsR/SmtB family transcription factor [Phycisphaerae bacterium]